MKIKKAVAVLMALVVVFGTLPAVFADNDKISFAVATDIHAEGKGEPLPLEFPENELYFHARNSGNLYNEALGILESFLAQAAEKKLDFVLLTGDMTNSGKQEQHILFASILEAFEKETGISVYVTPGNHDYANSSPADFKEYYARFGYDEALAIDDVTASYTVDLPNGYRLLSLDSQTPGKDGDALDERLFAWAETQAVQAEKDGKTLIAMMHCPLLDPIPLAELIMKDFIVRDHKDVAELFTKWNIQYVFTGHEHGNNISSFTGSNGNKVYDILTTSLTSYPLEYRTVDLSSAGMDIKCNSIDTFNPDSCGTGYNDAQNALIESDYTEYSYGYFKYSIEKKIAKYITAPFIEDKLNVTEGVLFDAIEAVMPLVEEALQMPLYAKDTDGNSIEALANKAGAKLPESDYYNLYDLATTAVASIYYGAENMPLDSSPEARILVVGLNTGLKYILAEAGNKTTELALNAIFSSIGLDKIEGLDIYRWNRALVLGADHSYDVALSVLNPFLEKLLVDDEICDRDVTLPAPGEKAEQVSGFRSFLDTLIKVFLYIVNVIKTVLFLPF